MGKSSLLQPGGKNSYGPNVSTWSSFSQLHENTNIISYIKKKKSMQGMVEGVHDEIISNHYDHMLIKANA